MKTWLRYSLSLVVAAALCAAAILVLLSDRKQKADIVCTGISVTVEGEEQFVSDADIKRYIAGEYGTCIGRKCTGLELEKIEDILDNKSAVLKSEAWITYDGIMHICVSQRKPVVRFQKGDYGFYADERGYIFPLHPSYTAPVPTVKGNIPVNAGRNYRGAAGTEREREWISGLITMLDYIGSRAEWKDRFASITVRSNGDLVLGQAEGNESFIFGSPDGYRDKLDRIATYYRRIAPAIEEGYYTSVNVKYNGQIVCRR